MLLTWTVGLEQVFHSAHNRPPLFKIWPRIDLHMQCFFQIFLHWKNPWIHYQASITILLGTRSVHFWQNSLGVMRHFYHGPLLPKSSFYFFFFFLLNFGIFKTRFSNIIEAIISFPKKSYSNHAYQRFFTMSTEDRDIFAQKHFTTRDIWNFIFFQISSK